MTGHSKKKKKKWFPPISTRLFLVYIQYVHLNDRVSGYLDLKFINLSLFGVFLGVFMQKGTKWSITWSNLNLNNRRLWRLKVHIIHQKKYCTDGGNPTKNLHFLVTSHFNEVFLYADRQYIWGEGGLATMQKIHFFNGKRKKVSKSFKSSSIFKYFSYFEYKIFLPKL